MLDLLSLALGGGAGLAAGCLLLGARARRDSSQAARHRDAELTRLREQHRADLDEIAVLRRAVGAPDPRIASENAELRRRLDELADLLMRTGPAEPR